MLIMNFPHNYCIYVYPINLSVIESLFTSKNLDVLLKPSMEELCQTELRNKKKKKKKKKPRYIIFIGLLTR